MEQAQIFAHSDSDVVILQIDVQGLIRALDRVFKNPRAVNWLRERDVSATDLRNLQIAAQVVQHGFTHNQPFSEPF